MMVDTRVYGYAWEGFIECVPCTREHADERSGALFDAETGARATAIFSHEDDGYGWQCDTCGDDIFETWPEIAHTEYGDHDDETIYADECEHCREYVSTHKEHANDAWNMGAERFEDWCYDCGTLVTDARDGHAQGEHADLFDGWCPVCIEQRAREASTEALGL